MGLRDERCDTCGWFVEAKKRQAMGRALNGGDNTLDIKRDINGIAYELRKRGLVSGLGKYEGNLQDRKALLAHYRYLVKLLNSIKASETRVGGLGRARPSGTTSSPEHI